MIKLLTVDDEKGITDLLYNFFTGRGFHVIVANTAEEALKIVHSDKPDIIFLDITLGNVNGLDLLEKIKRIDKNTKVIMLTVHGKKDLMEKAKELGADEYIRKPFRIDYLEEVVIKKIHELMKERGM